jgi:hypothetical protein
MEERKMLERARTRHRRAEETAAAMRRYAMAAERDADEYSGRARQLADLLDADLPRAIATLDRVLDSLDAYVAVSGGSVRHVPSAAMPSAARTGTAQEPSAAPEVEPECAAQDHQDAPEERP